MPRMRFNVVAGAWFVALILGLVRPVAAELIQAPGGRAYPDIAGAVNGTQVYTYHVTTGTGTFLVSNTPFLLTTGPGSGDNVDIAPDSDGVRSQKLRLTLDRSGQLVPGGDQTYALYGSVVLDGQTYNGLLLLATPVQFGAHGGTGAAFHLDMKVTGGLLAPAFGPAASLALRPTAESPFDGSFTANFHTTIESSNTVGYASSALAAPVPEPSTLVVLLACGAGFCLQRRRRIARAELGI